jgi:hypothetical protein
MKTIKLPDDLRDFLQDEKLLEYDFGKCDAGKVTLNTFSELQLANLWVNTYRTSAENDDPNQGEVGYLVPAISLTKDCQDYDPRFLLLWLPEENLYGGFDTDHGNIWVFPDTTWTNIKENALVYLNAQWNPMSGISIPFKPWLKYEFTDAETLETINPVLDVVIS